MADSVATMPVVVPTDGMTVTESIRLKPGTYVLPHGMTIAADNVTIDGSSATIVGTDRAGTAITVRGRSGVTIRNCRIRDFYHGIAVHGGRDLTITGNCVTGTAEVVTNTVFLNIWEPAENAYGAGILLNRVENADVNDNNLQHQMNGLLTYHCRALRVRQNNACYNSGFGFHLFETCDSIFEENWADYCNRYQPRDENGVRVGAGSYGHMGADATGFLLIHGSCNNVLRRNFARLGGDGFFLAGRRPDGVDVPCNDNLFEENDGSLSPNIAFEATFSSGNIFRNNWADRCNYGFWLGFSSKNILEGNRMLWNRQAGIAVENGADMQVRDNDFQSNGNGILIWTRHSASFLATDNTNSTSRNWTITNNRFLKNGTGIAILANMDHGIRPATELPEDQTESRPRDHVIRDNDIQENRIGVHLCHADRTVIEKNKLAHNVEADLRRDDDHNTKLGPNLGSAGAYL